MQALVWDGAQATVVDSRPLPTLREDYLLIKTAAVALNPTDIKAVAQGRAAPNGLLGNDFAGTVLEVGPKVTKGFRPGDRVCGCTYGANAGNTEDGSFAEVIVAKGDTCIKIPDGVSFEDAATIPVSAITVGQGLNAMGLQLPYNLDQNTGQDRPFILVYGGSSSTGTLAIQYACLAGYHVISTCAPRNFELVRSRGAKAVFDYRDPECGQNIFAYTNGGLQLIFDTIGSEDGVKICMEAFSKGPGCRYGTLLLNTFPQEDVTSTSSILLKFRGEPFDIWGNHFEADEGEFLFAKKFSTLTEQLLEHAKLKTHPIIWKEHGLKGIPEGLSLMQRGQVSGAKLVYSIGRTCTA